MLVALLTALAMIELAASPEAPAAKPTTETSTADEPTETTKTAETTETTEPGEPTEPTEQVPEPPTLPEPPPAQPETSAPDDLTWQAPATCPSAAVVRRGIERRLGRTLAEGEARVDGRVRTTEAGFVLELRTTADEITDARTLEASDCAALADATALVVALAVDPVAVAEVLEAARAEPPVDEALVEPEPLPATPRPSSTPSKPPTEPETTEPRSEPGTGLEGGLLRATAGGGLGAVPGVTGAFSLAGGLQWRRARLELEGSYWIPRRTAPLDGASVGVQLGAAGVRGCGQIRRDRIEAPLCAGLLAGGMRGDGNGVPGARTAQGLWLAIEAGVGLSWWFVPRWALAGGFSAAIPLFQPAFEIGQEDPVRLFEPSPVAGRLWLGVELRLGSR